MKTRIVNTTTNLVVIREGMFAAGTRVIASIPPKTTFILHHEPCDTYVVRYYLESKPGELLELDVEGADEIRVFELSDCSGLEWFISERHLYDKEDDSANVNSLKEDACSRMKLIDVSCIRLGKLQNGVKICTAQCKNLVETCLEGIEHTKATYDTVIENFGHVWELYSSKKLRHLIRCLDKLLFILETIEDLMRTCKRRWCRMGLYLSTIPYALSEKKTITKFDILLKELSWNLDTVHYVLALSESAKLEWNEDERRYVLQSESGARDVAVTNFEYLGTGSYYFGSGCSHLSIEAMMEAELMYRRYVLQKYPRAIEAADRYRRYVVQRYSRVRAVATTEIEPIGTHRLYCEDRVHLLDQVNDKSARGKEKPVPVIVVADLFRWIYPSDFGKIHYFAREVLRGRLQDHDKTNQSNDDYDKTSQSEDAGAVPACFQLNPLHLDFIDVLSARDPKSVHRGKWRGEDVAISVTRIREHGQMLESKKEDSQMEAALLLKLQHPNVVEFFGYAFAENAPPPLYSGKLADSVSASYLVMELMQGDLYHEIRTITRKKPGRPFPDDVTVDILLQIVEAMSHVHDCGVIYRDLKAKNCLVNPRLPSQSNSEFGKFYTVKLADFDISKVLDPDASITDHTLRQGTTRWMAPEVWGIGVYVPGATGQKSAYDKSIDVYSFGMTCYEVISGEVPFHESRRNSELEAALQNEKRPVLPPGVTCPGRLVDLMSRCWSQKPSDRPDFNEIRKVLWTVKYEVEFQ